MIIRKAEDARGWTSIPNQALEDGRLSLKARGLLAYLLGRPDGWDTSARRLARSAHALVDGRDAILSGLSELQRTGYLVRSRAQDPSTGHWSSMAIIHAVPQPVPADQPTLEGWG